MCPMCYNDPPFGGGKTSCWDCVHPTCRHGLNQVGVFTCPEEHCNGTVCLDVNSAPKWQMDCNICMFELKLFEKDGAHKISVSKDECEECGSRLMHVEFNKTKTSPLSDGALERTSCIVC